jgi:hypothetical protein
MSGGPALADDAAMVLGIASTAMPFARTPEAEAERWLRLLRVHGEVGVALRELGVSDGPLADAGERTREDRGPSGPAERAGKDHGPSGAAGHEDRDAVAAVAEDAVRIAAQRGAGGVGTTDVLIAVMRVYGEDFDRVLRAHGTDRDAVLERLGGRDTT